MSPLGAASVAALGLAIALALWRPGDPGGPLEGAEGLTLDLRFRLRGTIAPPTELLILAADDLAMNTFGYPLPRSVLAETLRQVSAGGARAVAFDMLLTDASAGDRGLAEAIGAHPETILATSFAGDRPATDAMAAAVARGAVRIVERRGPGLPPPAGLLGPVQALADAAWLGHVDVDTAPEGSLRRVAAALPAAAGRDAPLLPALPVRAVWLSAEGPAAALHLRQGRSMTIGDVTVPLDPAGRLILDHYGPAGTIETRSLVAPGTDFEGRIVFVGTTAAGSGDIFPTPFDRSVPGVEALATVAGNLIDGRVLRRDAATALLDAALALTAGALAVWASSRRAALTLTSGLWVGAGSVLFGGFLAGLWLDAIGLAAALSVGGLAGTGARRATLSRRAANLGRYQSPLLVDLLAEARRPAFDGRLQAGAVLFVDAADFTARSAHLGPAGTADFLHLLHALYAETATAFGGVVDFEGDGAMLIFGLPEPRADDASRAMACALRLVQRVAALGPDDMPGGGLRVRVGGHFGAVSTRLLGAAGQARVSMSGQTVNAASRLQEAAKAMGAAVVLSDALVAAAGGPADMNLVPGGEIALRGVDAPLAIWRSGPPGEE